MPPPPPLSQPQQKDPSIQQDISALLLQQHRKSKHVLGDANCFFRDAVILSIQYAGSAPEGATWHRAVHIWPQSTLLCLNHGPQRGKNDWASHRKYENTYVLGISSRDSSCSWFMQCPFVHIYSRCPDKTTYYWLHYTQRMQSASFIKYSHLELAHPASIHFDCIIHETTFQPCLVPPKLRGKTSL